MRGKISKGICKQLAQSIIIIDINVPLRQSFNSSSLELHFKLEGFTPLKISMMLGFKL